MKDRGIAQIDVQLLDLVAEGRTNEEIGRALGFAPDTIKKYLGVLAGKLNVRANRTEIVAAGFRSGLLR